MTFDIQLAVADLDFNGCRYTDHPNLTVLRDRYPELGFVFDRLEDMQASCDNVDSQIESATDLLEAEVDTLWERNSDLRFALNQIKELTVDAEITNIIEDVL